MASADSLDHQFRRYLKSRAPRDLAPIFRELAPRLMAASRKAGLDDQGAEDVVQETFLALIESESRFDPTRPFLPWVQGIALRQIRAERRRRARLHQLLTTDSDETVGELRDRADPPDAMGQADFKKTLLAAIGAMSDANQVVLRAALIDGKSSAEICETTGLSRSAVAVRLHRGLKRLRRSLPRGSAMGLAAIDPSGQRGLDAVWESVTAGRAVPDAAQAAAESTAAESTAAGSPVAGSPAAGSPASGSLTALAALATVAVIGTAGWFALGFGNDAGLQATQNPLESPSPGADVAIAPAAPPPSLLHEDDPAPQVDGRVTAGGREAPSASRPDSVEAAQPSLSGQVLRVDGTPSNAGVEIFLLGSNPGLVLPKSPMVSVAVTEEGGRYRLDADQLDADRTPILVGRAEGRVAWADVPADALETGELPVLRLVPELTIDASVVDTSGRPVPDAQLAAWTQAPRFMAPPQPRERIAGFPWTRPYRHLFGAETDDQGQGVIGNLYGAESPGLITVASAWKPGYATATLATQLKKNDRRIELTFTLHPISELTLGGAILDSEGGPIEGAVVAFELRGESDPTEAPVLTTNADGVWDVPQEWLDDYPITLRIRREGFMGTDLVFEQANDLPTGRTRTVLERARTIRGQVVDTSGTPVPEAQVRVGTAVMGSRLVTDLDGRFECTAARNAPVFVAVRSEGPDGQRRAADFSLGTDATESKLVLPDLAGTMERVTVRLPDAAMDDSWRRVELKSLATPGFQGDLAPQELDGASAHFPRVPAGQWLAYGITASGMQLAEEFRVGSGGGDGATETLTFTDPKTGGHLDIHVAPRAFVPEGPFRVLARRSGWPRVALWFRPGPRDMVLETSRRGSTLEPLSLKRLKPGEWEIFARGDGWCTEHRVVNVSPGETVRLDLEPIESSVLKLTTPPVDSAGILTVEARPDDASSWRLVSLDVFAASEPRTVDVQVPSHGWSWRASMQSSNSEGTFELVFPRVHGAGRETPILLMDESIEVD